MTSRASMDRNTRAAAATVRAWLDEIVPLENASMPGRVVVQWDKDDCADMGIVKVDLLGLGMLSAVEDCVEQIAVMHGKTIDLSRIPLEDPAERANLQA